jgi:hypothetical protein
LTAASTFNRSSSRTGTDPLNAREAVIEETPASAATS